MSSITARGFIYNLPENHPKLIRATDIPMKHPFDYKRYHDEVRNRLFTEINRTQGRINPAITDQTGQLVKKVLYGGLFPPAIKSVCDTYGITVKGKKITPEDFPKYYSKAIIATDLPNYELIIYLRSKQKKEYHKINPDERRPFQVRAAYTAQSGFFPLARIHPANTRSKDHAPGAQCFFHYGTGTEIKPAIELQSGIPAIR